MTTLTMMQVDAFAQRLFEGNPAAVVLLKQWPDDTLLQAIAAENNLSETAYLVPRGDDYELRWFTPMVEVELCGHATLASAYVVFSELKPTTTEVVFHSRHAGALTVRREAEQLVMNFPSRGAEPTGAGTEPLDSALGCVGEQHLRFRDDRLVVYASAAEVASLSPDMTALSRLARMVIATAPDDDDYDFVSRVFVPAMGIDEDPVTGSAHCLLGPYWARRLGKQRLLARQLSRRGGTVSCAMLGGGRIELGGEAVLYARATILLPSRAPNQQ